MNYQHIQNILESINPQMYDFNRLEKLLTEYFYLTFRKLPLSLVIQHKKALLELTRDWVLFSLKHVASMLLIKDDLQQILGNSVNGHELEDLFPDSFIDCVEMAGLEEQLNKWIEEASPAPMPQKAVAFSNSSVSASREQGSPAPLEARTLASSSSSISASREQSSSAFSEEAAALSVASLSPSVAVQIPLPKISIKRSKASLKSHSEVHTPPPAPKIIDQGPLDDLRKRGVKRRELVARLRRLGFNEGKGRGSHIQMQLEGAPRGLTVPHHDQFKPRTLNGIIDQAKEALAARAQKNKDKQKV